LLKEGADVRWTGGGNTALHKAACYGHTRVVELLLEAGADPRAKDNYGKTPSDLARQNGHPELAAMLEADPVTRIAAKFQVKLEQYAAIHATLSSACATTVLPVVVRLENEAECEVLPFEIMKAVALVAGADVKLDVEMISFKDHPVTDMTVEEVQSELGLDEDGKLTVTMGECAVPVDVATANLQYMHVATERLQQCNQANRAAGQSAIQLALDEDIERMCSDGRWECEV